MFIIAIFLQNSHVRTRLVPVVNWRLYKACHIRWLYNNETLHLAGFRLFDEQYISGTFVISDPQSGRVVNNTQLNDFRFPTV